VLTGTAGALEYLPQIKYQVSDRCTGVERRFCCLAIFLNIVRGIPAGTPMIFFIAFIFFFVKVVAIAPPSIAIPS